VHEGQAQTVGPIEIKGLIRTSERFVRRQLGELKAGAPLDPRKLAAVERRLRGLGIFRRAVVTASQEPTATITIELDEAAPYTVAYDARDNRPDPFHASLHGHVQHLVG